jgi:hypothetical protein
MQPTLPLLYRLLAAVDLQAGGNPVLATGPDLLGKELRRSR